MWNQKIYKNYLLGPRNVVKTALVRCILRAHFLAWNVARYLCERIYVKILINIWSCNANKSSYVQYVNDVECPIVSIHDVGSVLLPGAVWVETIAAALATKIVAVVLFFLLFFRAHEISSWCIVVHFMLCACNHIDVYKCFNVVYLFLSYCLWSKQCIRLSHWWSLSLSPITIRSLLHSFTAISNGTLIKIYTYNMIFMPFYSQFSFQFGWNRWQKWVRKMAKGKGDRNKTLHQN